MKFYWKQFVVCSFILGPLFLCLICFLAQIELSYFSGNVISLEPLFRTQPNYNNGHFSYFSFSSNYWSAGYINFLYTFSQTPFNPIHKILFLFVQSPLIFLIFKNLPLTIISLYFTGVILGIFIFIFSWLFQIRY